MKTGVELFLCHRCECGVILLVHEGELFRAYDGTSYPHSFRPHGIDPSCIGDLVLADPALQSALALGGRDAIVDMLPKNWFITG